MGIVIMPGTMSARNSSYYVCTGWKCKSCWQSIMIRTWQYWILPSHWSYHTRHLYSRWFSEQVPFLFPGGRRPPRSAWLALDNGNLIWRRERLTLVDVSSALLYTFFCVESNWIVICYNCQRYIFKILWKLLKSFFQKVSRERRNESE